MCLKVDHYSFRYGKTYTAYLYVWHEKLWGVVPLRLLKQRSGLDKGSNPLCAHTAHCICVAFDDKKDLRYERVRSFGIMQVSRTSERNKKCSFDCTRPVKEQYNRCTRID